MSSEPAPKILLSVLLHRLCRQSHKNLGELRDCHGRFAHEGEDYWRITMEINDPWPQDRTT
jgi:hypothetical protein